jgi:glycosyltransferase involved in cell wall biosynthesis
MTAQVWPKQVFSDLAYPIFADIRGPKGTPSVRYFHYLMVPLSYDVRMSLERLPVSIIAPVRNAEKHLLNLRHQAEAISLPNDEIIVIDDFSEDQTSQFLTLWSLEDSRVRILRNKTQGLPNALNLGIQEATHTWMARMDADDRYRPDRLSRQLSLVTDQTVCIFSDYSFRTNSGRYLGFMPSAVHRFAVPVSLVNSRRTPHPVAIFRKDAVIEVGGYRTEDFPAEDLSLWLRLCRVGDLISIDETLLEYSLSLGGVSLNSRKLQIYMRNHLIQSIGVGQEYLSQAQNAFHEIIENYSGNSHSKLRTLLFMQDFSKVSGKSLRSLLLDSNLRIRSKENFSVSATDIANYYLMSAARASFRITHSFPLR